MLWATLNGPEPSPLLDDVRARWKAAGPADATAIAEEIGRWQSRLWKFNSVGHIGKVGGPKSWMEPVSPLLTRQEFRLPIPALEDGKDVTLYLVADDAGDGSEHDAVVWERPRLVAPGMPDLLLRDVRAVVAGAGRASRSRLRRHRQEPGGGGRGGRVAGRVRPVRAWPASTTCRPMCSRPGSTTSAWHEDGGAVTITSHLQGQIVKGSGYDFVNGWGPGATPNMVANSSDTHVRVPGNLKPHSVAMHPSPTLRVAAGWLSPVSGALRISGKVQHAHPECGNGVTWSLEVRRGATRQRLAAGVAQGGNVVQVGPFEAVPVRPGDLVSLVIGPRDGNHSCDLTAVDLTLTGDGKTWDLAADVSPDVLAGNPHADRLGNPDVWHFYTEPDRGGDSDAVIPDRLGARALAVGDDPRAESRPWPARSRRC